MPKMLLPKLELVDREAFSFNDRKRQMAAIRAHLKDKEWLLVAGMADTLVNTQRINRRARFREFIQRKRRDEAVRKR